MFFLNGLVNLRPLKAKINISRHNNPVLNFIKNKKLK